MDIAPPVIRQGEPAASGAASITVEKHKNNFMAQHGTFEDKPSQNIVRWLAKAQKYKEAHMIPSLEMASIVIHCIRGEPAIKVRRMLDVPGENYIHSDHFCEQPYQQAVPYSPYRERVPEVHEVDLVQGVEAADAVIANELLGIVAADEQIFVQHVDHVAHADEIPARPAIMPVRHQPNVLHDQCLKHYLTTIYQKQVNLSEAEKFLNTFKLQKPRQTCSNFMDTFAINYENFAHMKWSTVQLYGVRQADEIIAQPDAIPPIAAADAVEEQEGNQATRNAEMIHLVTDGICKEFKVHCDNRQIDLTDITFPALEIEVIKWQRNTIIGKAFTAQCTPATLSQNSNVSALEVTDYFDHITLSEDMRPLEGHTSAINPSQMANRANRGQRGNRNMRGARSSRGRAPKTKVVNSTNGHVQSKDAQEGGFFNYRQNQDGTLQTSMYGHPLCNYCGTPSHKRENCGIKRKDREAGVARTFHPSRDKPLSYKEKAKVAAASLADYMPISAHGSAVIAQPTQPYPIQWPYQPPPIQTYHEPQSTWQPQPIQRHAHFPNNDIDNNQTRNSQNAPVTAAAQTFANNHCPYSACQAVLPNQNMAQEHIRVFHSQQDNLATRPDNHL